MLHNFILRSSHQPEAFNLVICSNMSKEVWAVLSTTGPCERVVRKRPSSRTRGKDARVADSFSFDCAQSGGGLRLGFGSLTRFIALRMVCKCHRISIPL